MLLPAEKIVLTVALGMVGRGEGLPPNIAAVVVGIAVREEQSE